MGVKNWSDLVPWRWVSIDELRPRVIAIDAPNYLTRRHQAYASKSRSSTERIPTFHLSAALGVIHSCLSRRLLPVFVFDGPPEALKRKPNPELVRHAADLYSEYYASGDIYNTRIAEELVASPSLHWYFSVNHIKAMCAAIGIPSLTAATEAEMTAAVLCEKAMAGSVMSNDVDALLFGSPHVTRTAHLGKGLIERCMLGDLKKSIGLSLSMIRDLAIVCGCDFHEGVKGIGPRKGIVLLGRYGGLRGLLKARGYTQSEIDEIAIAREVFEEARFISTESIQVKLAPPVIPLVHHILEPIMGVEAAQRQVASLVKSWKDFRKEQTTLEYWVKR
jgi:flap endonuclease-1